MLFVQYPKCTTCKKAEAWLKEQGADYESRHIKEANPTAEELRTWAARAGLPVRKFFNTSGILYKELHLKDRLGVSGRQNGRKPVRNRVIFRETGCN